jgi:predicted lysophospholipase L1 biosynthesis ABC-type transport system permease subunit
MEFDLTRTAALFLAVIAVGVAVLLVMNVMATNIVLMMVLPAMLVFGLICLGLGVQHGEHRATR